jgi:hypothetical protein
LVTKWQPREGAVMEISCWNQTGVGILVEVSLLEEEAKDGLGQARDLGLKDWRGAKAQVAIKQHEVVAWKSKRAVVVRIFMVVEDEFEF